MGTKTTLLLTVVLVLLSFFVVLYLLNPTYTKTLIAGVKNYAVTTVSTFFGNVTKDPATAVVPVLGATSLVGGLAYKIVSKVKAKAAEAESFALQKQSQTLEITNAFKEEVQKNTELEKKLAVYEKDGDAVTALKEINTDLQAQIDNRQRQIEQLSTERDTVQRNYKLLLEQILSDPTLKTKYEKYAIQ